MRQANAFSIERRAVFRSLLLLVVSCIACPTRELTAADPVAKKTDGRQMLWVTNSAGNDVHIIDVATLKVVQRLEVGALPHGIAAPDDAKTVYVALEGEVGELLWVNPRTYAIEHRLKVGPRCNQLACTPDGNWVYIPCDDGQYWVIDGVKKEVVTKIRTGGRPHNTQASRDGKLMYLSPMGNPRQVTIVDVLNGHKVVGQIPFDNVVRPPALSADGKRLYQNIDGLLGFQAADTEKREVIGTARHEIPAEFQAEGSRCHGLAIHPNQKEIWSCNVEHQIVHIHDLTQSEMPQVAAIPMIGKIYWLCFSPDGKYGFISVRSKNQVAVVETASRKVITHIDVGEVPKRNLVITLKD